nr:MAG TPA_asm: hypothetical protein [Bacteriophage sp.]
MGERYERTLYKIALSEIKSSSLYKRQKGNKV